MEEEALKYKHEFDDLQAEENSNLGRNDELLKQLNELKREKQRRSIANTSKGKVEAPEEKKKKEFNQISMK